MPRLKNIALILTLGILISLPLLLPYLKPGFFPTHDGEWAVVRAAEMFRELRDLQIPPRFSQALNFGFGYPLFNFAYPGPYFLTTFIHAFGFGFVDSVKIVFMASIPMSFYGMYLFSSSIFKKRLSGILSAVLYIFLPYRMVDLYARGNIGEAVAFALFPFLFYFLYKIIISRHKIIYVVGTAILTATLITSHNIMSVYFGITFLAFVISVFVSQKTKEAFYMLLSVTWGAGLSAFFIIPALLEKSYIKLSITPIADRNLYFVTIEKLLWSKWGYGTPTDSNPFPYQIGIPQLISVLFIKSAWKKIKPVEKNIIKAFLILLAFFILIMFPLFSFAWRLPLLSEINYPWTLLLPISFLVTFLSGGVLFFKKGKILAILLCALAALLYLPMANPSEYIDRGEDYYITNEATTTSSNELMPLWVEKEPANRFTDKVVVEDGAGYTDSVLYDSKKISFAAEMKQDGVVTINTIYYPGWNAYVNNSRAVIMYDNPQGLMQLHLPAGPHQVALHFYETPMRLLANGVTVVSLLCVFGTFFTLFILKITENKKGQRKQKASKSL